LSQQITEALIDAGLSPDRVLTMPFGVDFEMFSSPACKAGRPIDVICTRNLDDVYNLPLLLRALPLVIHRHPELKCVLAGDGPRRDELKRLAKSLDLDRHIRWVGWVTSAELASLLQQSKVYVSPSLSDGTSTALTEAMACGCFPIVTDIPANRPWIEHSKTGFLVPLDKPEELASRILQSLEFEELRVGAIHENRERVQRDADWRAIMGRMEDQYRMLAHKNSGNGPGGQVYANSHGS
jgi:glycosyltransferase involved in cell wall biosynthesis